MLEKSELERRIRLGERNNHRLSEQVPVSGKRPGDKSTHLCQCSHESFLEVQYTHMNWYGLLYILRTQQKSNALQLTKGHLLPITIIYTSYTDLTD